MHAEFNEALVAKLLVSQRIEQVVELLKFFEYAHLPEHLQAVSKPFGQLAADMASKLEGGQVVEGLKKLLEAKDCFVRALVAKP